MSGAKARSDAPVADNVSGGGHSTAAPPRDRKTGGGVLKRLKSRRSQVDSRPVTEEDLRTQSGHITPEDVLGLRVATRGLSHPLSLSLSYVFYLRGHTMRIVLPVLAEHNVTDALQIILHIPQTLSQSRANGVLLSRLTWLSFENGCKYRRLWVRMVGENTCHHKQTSLSNPSPRVKSTKHWRFNNGRRG